MKFEVFDNHYLINGIEFTRVSTVCDAIERLESESLVFVGATWAADRALEATTQVMNGEYPLWADNWCRVNDATLHDWLVSDDFKRLVKAGATQKQQNARDRGTLLNIAFDAFIDGTVETLSDAKTYIETEIESRAAEAKLSRNEHKDAKEMGLADGSKPLRCYQCGYADVEPYLESLFFWWIDSGFVVDTKQQLVVDTKSKVAGTYDYTGTMNGYPCLADLKSSSGGNPTRGHRAQLAKYMDMTGMKIGYNIIVKQNGVALRQLSDEGFKKGMKDFKLGLDVYRNSSMKGSYLTQRETARGVA